MTTPSPAVVCAITAAEAVLWDGDARACDALLDDARRMAITDVDRYAVGEALLRATNGRHGWDLYNLHPSRAIDTLPGIPRWDGQPCEHLVIVAEQGFGDAIQFLRYVPRVAHLAPQTTFAVHDELLPLLTAAPYLAGVNVIAKSAARRTCWPAGTRWERLMSLSIHLPSPPVEALPAYLRPRGTRSVSVRRSDGITVGVAWRSTPRRGFANRSMPARVLAPLTRTGAHVVALHRSNDIRSLPAGVVDPGIEDFKDTADVISQCDVVVTVDTVTAHLAPALGVPTVLCLLHRPDWRWGCPDRPTRWYAQTHPLFRGLEGGWLPVINAATTAIPAVLGRSQPVERTWR